MLETINLYVEKVCFFMIAAELLFHFLPSKKYEKYMGMITGFLCMAILVIPIGNLVFQGEKWLSMDTTEEFEKQLKQVMTTEDMEQIKQQYQSVSKTAEGKYLGQEEVKEKIQPVVARYGYIIKDISYDAEEEKLILTLLENTTVENGIEIEKIVVTKENTKKVPKELIENIAKELMMDEEAIWIR